MGGKTDRLFRLLQSNACMTGKQLARELGVTPRTVINYIRQINEQSGAPVIISSPAGYSLNSASHYDLPAPAQDIPQDRQQRFLYLLKLLLLSPRTGVDAFDLADEMLVSYSLLKKEIAGFNDTLKAFRISIVSHNNIISIEGSERDKRRVVSAFIRKEQQGNVLDLEQLQNYFGEEMIRCVSRIIREEVQRGDSSINDFSLLNLLLHLCIVIDRLRLGQSLREETANPIRLHVSADSGEVAHRIIERVEAAYGVTLGPIDRAQMTSLIQAHIHTIGCQAADPAEELRDNELFVFLKETMEELRHTFYLDFTSLDFLVPFTLHVSNLLLRLTNHIQIENPVKDTFRDSSAFLYDVAVALMNRLTIRYGITEKVSDDEFSFIVMHLALEMERQRHNAANVRCLLYFPKYLTIAQDLPARLQQRFEDSMEIVAVVDSREGVQTHDFDILISYVDAAPFAAGRFVRISPVPTFADYTRLDEAITAVAEAKLLENFRLVFPFYFEEKNFFFREDAMVQQDAIHLLCRNLVEGGYVDADFEARVLDREKAISTAYDSFALPHAVSPGVRSACVSVLVCPGGIRWEEKTVFCVMLMAVDPQELTDFQTMYNALSLRLLEADFVEHMKKCPTFPAFQKLMLTGRP